MSEVIATLGKYGALSALAAIAPWFVFGFMAGSVVPTDNHIAQVIAVLAWAGIVAAATKEDGPVGGILAAVGIGSGGFMSVAVGGIVKDVVLSTLGNVLGPFLQGLLGLLWKPFLMGFGLGIVAGALAIGMGIVASTVIAIIFALLVAIVTRISGLLYEALEVAVHELFKVAGKGFMALLAPVIGALLVGIPVSALAVALGAVMAFFAGYALGLAVSLFIGAIYVVGAINAFASLLMLFGLSTLLTNILKSFRGHSGVDVLLDLAALALVPWLAYALWPAGYAGLLTRRRTHALYLIGLSAVAIAFGLKAPFTLL